MALFTLALSLARAETQAAAPVVPSRPDSSLPWKIDEAHGPNRTVAFETDEGTWISLDVSPDGKTVAFSLLGDLYLVPLSGGTARRITSGPAYDVQPRFSPDGASLAFASDRGGSENLWVADALGNNARAVSSEKDAYVNSPAWSPDGDYLVGRKRLTDASSLGSVELWMWHVKGGQGVRVTKKEDQPDAADPAFSRDGRFLYFSARDARYKYDRNVNEGIWQIKRFDRRTGQVVQVMGEFGGTATPTLSPDGKSLAYVRRVRAKTRLEVLDLASGRTRVVVPEVQRDDQEGFAFHGVFPGFAWTPDGQALVATAEGKMWSFDQATGGRRAVPFTAAVEQRVTEALRTPHRITDMVRARILRWPVESPDGKRLVFQSLGHLYVMDLPGGAPRRLTTLTDPEFAPAFSRDGRSIAFVTWNDTAGGHVWTLEGAGPPKRLTEVAGQYANPSFSPDGSKVVFLRGSGATFRDADLSDELWHEIHWVKAEGGASHYVIGTKNRGTNRRMTRPTFAADGERVFYVEDDKQEKPTDVPKTLLCSIKLDGTDRRVRLKWARAEEAAVSPDERHVVFNELHNAYVTALPEAGAEPVEIALENGALPLGTLTDEGGEWVGWADGGKTVTWIFGPLYHRLALEKALPVPMKPEEKPAAAKKDSAKEAPKKPAPLPPSQKIEIALSVPRARPTGLVAYKGARVVTMKGDEVLEGATLLVEGDRIKAVGTALTVPTEARVVDVSGRTIIPGLIDEHAHLHYSSLDIFPERPWKYLANLAYGITTTHDPSASSHEAFGQSEMVEAGLMTGPRIFSTGIILYGADRAGGPSINNLDDARQPRAPHEAARRDQREELHAAAARAAAVDPARPHARRACWWCPKAAASSRRTSTMVLDGHTGHRARPADHADSQGRA